MDILTQANIDNLTQLWKTAATPLQAYLKCAGFEYCEIQHSDWPNKLWFNQDLTEQIVEAAIQQLHLSSTKLSIPYWDVFGSKSYELLETKGLVVKSSQVGMYLKLDKLFTSESRLEFKRVTAEEEFKIWAAIYPTSFRYRISEEILANTYKDIHYYLICFQGQPIGTAMQYATNGTAGIHGVGVIPEMRRMGFAKEIMIVLLNEAINLNATHVTLQASAMGKGLYDQLGFKEQFTIRNYILKPELDKK